nr:extracellular solute-binding protein [Lachnospiraceae bacterium]
MNASSYYHRTASISSHRDVPSIIHSITSSVVHKVLSYIPVLLLTISCVLLPAGCHGRRGNDPFVLPESFDTTRNYEITFWAKNDTNKTQTDIYNQAIKDFEALYPNIHVNIRLYTDYGRIYNDVITNISTNTTPNVCITYPDHIATYMTGLNTVVPLDELFSDSRYGLGGSEIRFDSPTLSEIVPKFLEECRIGEDHYAIPYMRSTEACYINKTFVEALGYTVPDVLTWDYIWEVSDAATAKNADGTFVVNSQNVMIPFIYKSTDNMMIQYLAQKNAGYTTADGDVLIFNDAAFDFLGEIKNHVENGAFSTFKISSYPANFLNAGQCIFAIDSTAGSTWMGSQAPLSDIAEDMFVDF